MTHPGKVLLLVASILSCVGLGADLLNAQTENRSESEASRDRSESPLSSSAGQESRDFSLRQPLISASETLPPGKELPQEQLFAATGGCIEGWPCRSVAGFAYTHDSTSAPLEEVHFPNIYVWDYSHQHGSYADDQGMFSLDPNFRWASLMESPYFEVQSFCRPDLSGEPSDIILLAPSFGAQDLHWGSAEESGCSHPTDFTGYEGNTNSVRTTYFHLHTFLKEVRARAIPSMVAWANRYTSNYQDAVRRKAVTHGRAAAGEIERTQYVPDRDDTYSDSFVFQDARPCYLNDFQTPPCAENGEIGSILWHEFAHALTMHKPVPEIVDFQMTAEGEADAFSYLYLGNSCIGEGNYFGLMCDMGDPCTNCTGLRDIDYTKHGLPGTTPTPYTPSNIEDKCRKITKTPKGPLLQSAYCENQIASQTIFDLVNGSYLDAYGLPEGKLEFVKRLWWKTYEKRGRAYNPLEVSDPPLNGCDFLTEIMWFGAFMREDKNSASWQPGEPRRDGGSPHASGIFAAFNAHGIACGSREEPRNNDLGTCPTDRPTAVVAVSPWGTGTTRVDWAPAGNSNSYRVYRGAEGCPDTTMKFLGSASAPPYEDKTSGGNLYGYQVSAIGSNDICEGDRSVCVNTCIPNKITNFTAKNNIENVKFEFTPIRGVSSYEIYHSLNSCQDVSLLETCSDVASCSHTAVPLGTHYYRARPGQGGRECDELSDCAIIERRVSISGVTPGALVAASCNLGLSVTGEGFDPTACASPMAAYLEDGGTGLFQNASITSLTVPVDSNLLIALDLPLQLAVPASGLVPAYVVVENTTTHDGAKFPIMIANPPTGLISTVAPAQVTVNCGYAMVSLSSAGAAFTPAATVEVRQHSEQSHALEVQSVVANSCDYSNVSFLVGLPSSAGTGTAGKYDISVINSTLQGSLNPTLVSSFEVDPSQSPHPCSTLDWLISPDFGGLEGMTAVAVSGGGPLFDGLGDRLRGTLRLVNQARSVGVDISNATRFISPSEIRTTLPAAPAGSYDLIYTRASGGVGTRLGSFRYESLGFIPQVDTGSLDVVSAEEGTVLKSVVLGGHPSQAQLTGAFGSSDHLLVMNETGGPTEPIVWYGLASDPAHLSPIRLQATGEVVDFFLRRLRVLSSGEFAFVAGEFDMLAGPGGGGPTRQSQLLCIDLREKIGGVANPGFKSVAATISDVLISDFDVTTLARPIASGDPIASKVGSGGLSSGPQNWGVSAFIDGEIIVGVIHLIDMNPYVVTIAGGAASYSDNPNFMTVARSAYDIPAHVDEGGEVVIAKTAAGEQLVVASDSVLASTCLPDLIDGTLAWNTVGLAGITNMSGVPSVGETTGVNSSLLVARTPVRGEPVVGVVNLAGLSPVVEFDHRAIPNANAGDDFVPMSIRGRGGDGRIYVLSGSVTDRHNLALTILNTAGGFGRNHRDHATAQPSVGSVEIAIQPLQSLGGTATSTRVSIAEAPSASFDNPAHQGALLADFDRLIQEISQGQKIDAIDAHVDGLEDKVSHWVIDETKAAAIDLGLEIIRGDAAFN